jgi:uncharacterized Zn-finger protein
MKTEPLKALNAAKSPWEFSANKQPVCPHCGDAYDIERNDAWRLYDENDTHEVDCPSCDGIFRVNSHASWSFSTDEQRD